MTGLGVGAQFVVDGRPAPPPEQRTLCLARSVTQDYFHAMGIPLVAGRTFGDADTAQSAPVAIINQTMARRFWPGASPLGGRLALEYGSPRVAEIVGVVGDVKPEGLDKDDWPTVYHPYSQAPATGMTMVIHTAGPPLELARSAAGEVHRLDPDQPLADVRTMEEILSKSVAGARFNAAVLGIFGGLSFLLAAVGIYGVVSYDVGERTHEIGIRAALGAQRKDLLRLVLGHAGRLAACGIAVGLAAAWALTRLMAAMLFQVNPRDFYTYAAISLMLGVVALVAGYFPSRRAMALDPVVALRHE